MVKNILKIGLIGGGYIGKTHAIAYRNTSVIFDHPVDLELYMLAEVDRLTAQKRAKALGFSKSTANWKSLINDPEVDIVAIATPNAQHKDMAIAALKAGKHVYCEKPLALDAAEAGEMAQAAKLSNLVNMVGYNYLVNPIISLCKDIIDRGDIGDIIHFRGRHNEDYMADPTEPFNWRCDRSLSGTGTLGDMGSHIICMAMYLVGEIIKVSADMETVIKDRPTIDGGVRSVENDDQTHCIVRFKNGAMGILETSRVAQGRKLGLAFEIIGTKGSIIFDQERMNELKLYQADQPPAENGFKTILVNGDHPDFLNFCPAAGHGLGYNDLKTIEVSRLIDAITNGRRPPVDFEQATKIEQVIDACVLSATEMRWVEISEI